MDLLTLTGAQKTRLRGLGQTIEVSLKIGKAGYTHALQREFSRLIEMKELVKIRIEGADRHERAALIALVEQESGALCAGAVGHTAVFYRQNPEPEKQLIKL